MAVTGNGYGGYWELVQGVAGLLQPYRAAVGPWFSVSLGWFRWKKRCLKTSPALPRSEPAAGQLERPGASLSQFIPCTALSSPLRLLPYANPPVPPQTPSSVSLLPEMRDSSPGEAVPYLGFSSVRRSGMLGAFAANPSSGAASPTPPPPCQCCSHLQPVSQEPAGGLKELNE